ncbi:hypothetical protein VQ045_18410 [Aurantimonas sp. E1-2-R+4]|uniref:hypothetical protein n=1 Tax=Aurantimonas sp. E1-2-R+4 TaxID=3113714 RepID=UPI002F9352CA
MNSANEDANRRAVEAKILQNLLATPPQPKTSKTKESAPLKKRGRPPKKDSD